MFSGELSSSEPIVLRGQPEPRVESDLLFAGHVRLDDRETLAKKLALDPSTTDDTLVIEAWRKWGESCAQHLYGDWVCAIWNCEKRTLWIARDAAGNTGLYYWHDAGRLVFSTSLKSVLAHPSVPRRPYAYHVARQLAVVSDPDEGGSTAWEGVRRLPGGHALRCDGTTVERYAWWRPESLRELTLKNDDDYYEAFREIYANAVSDRLQTGGGPIALMLSAGLDSGSVAAFAAPRLRERLIAYTSVPHFSPDGAPATRLGNEEAFARATADHVGNIDFVAVRAEESGIMESIEEMLRIHDQPQHATSNQYWIHEILKLARNRGARVMLTGQGGNATVSWTGYGKVRRALKPVREAWRRLRRRRAPWNAYSPIHPQFAEEMDLHHHELHDPDFRLTRVASAHIGATWMELGAAYGMDVRDPTRDRRLIEFCWRVPDRIFWANGSRRGLITKGMRGMLPERVLHSRKGLQAADLGHRVLADRAAVENAIQRIEKHPIARVWLDVPRMRSVVDSLQRGVTHDNTMDAVTILVRGLGTGLFLTRF